MNRLTVGVWFGLQLDVVGASRNKNDQKGTDSINRKTANKSTSADNKAENARLTIVHRLYEG